MIAFGLYRYRLFDIAFVARSVIIDQIQESVIVVDAQNRLVDINPVTEHYIGRDASSLIGRSSDEVFFPWLDIVQQFRRVEQTTTNLELDIRGIRHYVEMRINPLGDRKGKLIGRVFILRDITLRKKAEIELQLYKDQLEELVQTRTRELQGPCSQLKEEIAEKEKLEEQVQSINEINQGHRLCLKR